MAWRTPRSPIASVIGFMMKNMCWSSLFDPTLTPASSSRGRNWVGTWVITSSSPFSSAVTWASGSRMNR